MPSTANVGKEMVIQVHKDCFKAFLRKVDWNCVEVLEDNGDFFSVRVTIFDPIEKGRL